MRPCPNCGALVTPGASDCPKCGVTFGYEGKIAMPRTDRAASSLQRGGVAAVLTSLVLGFLSAALMGLPFLGLPFILAGFPILAVPPFNATGTHVQYVFMSVHLKSGMAWLVFTAYFGLIWLAFVSRSPHKARGQNPTSVEEPSDESLEDSGGNVQCKCGMNTPRDHPNCLWCNAKLPIRKAPSHPHA
jgi:hypothetical protein